MLLKLTRASFNFGARFLAQEQFFAIKSRCLSSTALAIPSTKFQFSNQKSLACYKSNLISIHLVGTVHISKKSQEDVLNIIRHTQPNVVFVELCDARKNIFRHEEIMESESLTWKKMVNRLLFFLTFM